MCGGAPPQSRRPSPVLSTNDVNGIEEWFEGGSGDGYVEDVEGDELLDMKKVDASASTESTLVSTTDSANPFYGTTTSRDTTHVNGRLPPEGSPGRRTTRAKTSSRNDILQTSSKAASSSTSSSDGISSPKSSAKAEAAPSSRKYKKQTKTCRPGTTAKGDERRFVQHNYTDRSNEVPDGPDIDLSVYTGSGGFQKKLKTAPFPIKLHIMLANMEMQGTNHIASWFPHGRAFIIHQPKLFVEKIMPEYFKQSKMTSFNRQLNLYGFNRITKGQDRGGYYSEYFLRGKPFLTKLLKRFKVKGTKVRPASSPDMEPDFYAMTELPPSACSTAAARVAAFQQENRAVPNASSGTLSNTGTTLAMGMNVPSNRADTGNFGVAVGHGVGVGAGVGLALGAQNQSYQNGVVDYAGLSVGLTSGPPSAGGPSGTAPFGFNLNLDPSKTVTPSPSIPGSNDSSTNYLADHAMGPSSYQMPPLMTSSSQSNAGSSNRAYSAMTNSNISRNDVSKNSTVPGLDMDMDMDPLPLKDDATGSSLHDIMSSVNNLDAFTNPSRDDSLEEVRGHLKQNWNNLIGAYGGDAAAAMDGLTGGYGAKPNNFQGDASTKHQYTFTQVAAPSSLETQTIMTATGPENTGTLETTTATATTKMTSDTFEPLPYSPNDPSAVTESDQSSIGSSIHSRYTNSILRRAQPANVTSSDRILDGIVDSLTFTKEEQGPLMHMFRNWNYDVEEDIPIDSPYPFGS